MSGLELYLLGPPRIDLDSSEVKLDTRKTLALIVYLAVTVQRHRRDSLVNLLWPESNQVRGRALLRNSLYTLNKSLGGGWIKADQETISLDPDAELWVDVNRFRSLISECETHGHDSGEVCRSCLNPLREAMDIYRSDFLTGFTLKNSVNFDDWQLSQTQALKAEMSLGFERLISCFKDEGDKEKAIRYARRWLELDSVNEVGHRQLMELYAHLGQRSAALRQYEECVRVLKEELGVSPEDETVELLESIRENRIRGEASASRAITESRSNNLPRQLTSFVGRKGEIAEIKRLLSTTPLLTLTGTGGCGKTRLALEVANEILADYRDGVWLAELAPLSDPALIPQAVASALDVQEQRNRSIRETLLAYLGSRQILIVMDNCEHLIQSCREFVNAMLHNCQNLKILVTSREPLHVGGEQEFTVPPLSVPENSLKQSVQELKCHEAVHLFIERAIAVVPEFAITDDNASAIAEICIRLDGLPLAIELAAARIKMLSPEELVRRMNDRFSLLRGADRDLPARQQTLRSEIGWSYDLLEAREKRPFSHLSVFTGGCTFEAAEAVCETGSTEMSVFELLAALVDKSLLKRQEIAGESRYTMLETIREYALERLEENGETEASRRRHAEFFLDFAEKAEPELHGPDQLRWLDCLEREYANLRTALLWFVNNGEIQSALRLAGALLWMFWLTRGYYSEGKGWLEEALALAEGSRPTKAKAKALYAAGAMSFFLGNLSAAKSRFKESVCVYRKLGDKSGTAIAMALLGVAVRWTLGWEEKAPGLALCEESIKTARETDDPWTVAFTIMWSYGLRGLDIIAVDPREAELEEAATLFREVGDSYGLAFTKQALGSVYRCQGIYGRAHSHYDEALGVFQEFGDRFMKAKILTALGRLSVLEGNTERAEAGWKDSLMLFAEIGAEHQASLRIADLASIAQARGRRRRTARLLGAHKALMETITNPAGKSHRGFPYLREEFARYSAEYPVEWGEGQAMTLEQAIEYALSDRA